MTRGMPETTVFMKVEPEITLPIKSIFQNRLVLVGQHEIQKQYLSSLVEEKKPAIDIN